VWWGLNVRRLYSSCRKFLGLAPGDVDPSLSPAVPSVEAQVTKVACNVTCTPMNPCVVCTPCSQQFPCLESHCKQCWGDDACTPDAVILCGNKFDDKSHLMCCKQLGHEGGHQYRYPDAAGNVTPAPAENNGQGTAAFSAAELRHTYFIHRKTSGLLRCCYVYLKEFIGTATKEGWPTFTTGFRTRCTKCGGWIVLTDAKTFKYDGGVSK